MKNEKKNPFLCNVGLLSLSFFLGRVEREDDFKNHNHPDIKNLWNELRSIFLKNEKLLNNSKINESDTEKYLIDEVLKKLDFSYLTKSSVKSGKKSKVLFPDYALFESSDDANSALDADDEFKFRKALGILEAKKFGFPLNDVDVEDDDDRLPAVQLVDYLLKTNVSWGILTNGKQWQLYFGRGQYAIGRFFEVELTDLLSHPVCTHEFAVFAYLFERKSLDKNKNGQCRLDRLFEKSKSYSQEIGVPFFSGCEDALRTIFSFYQGSFSASKDEFKSRQCHQASLILLFRLIAIRYLEDRGVLPTLDTRYRDMSLDKMRLSVEKTIREGDKFSSKNVSLWQKIRLLFKDINTGVFGIYPGHKGFESNLFELDFDTFFRDHPMPDSIVSKIIDSICRGVGKELGQIDFYDLGVEKIGDVYNQLLALRIVENDKKIWNLTYSESLKKELGSYFTHPKLTHLLSESVNEYLDKHYPNNSDWLKLRICDNSCGSGHFLRQVIEDISYRLYISKENTSKKEVSKVLDQNSFRRMLAQHCIFGIDKDINAVWLTKLSLWLHTAETGKPFVFLDHHIIQGDSILSTVEIPKLPEKDFDDINELIVELNKQHSEDKNAVRQSDKLYARLKAVTKKHVKLTKPQLSFFDTSREVKETYFSYALSFPEVFLNKSESLRGFSIIVGNPPWETVKPKIPEFYKLQTGCDKAPSRKKLDQWVEENKARKSKYEHWVNEIKNYSKAIKESSYSYQAGEVNTYSYFTERSMQTLRVNGLLCYIVKLGLYGDEKVKNLRNHLFKDNYMEKMFVFKANKIEGQKFFTQIDPNEKFLVFVNRKGGFRGNKEFEYDTKAKEVNSLADVDDSFEDWQSYRIPSSLDELSKFTIYSEEKTKAVCDKLLRQTTIRGHGLVVGRELDQTMDRNIFTEKETDIRIYTGSEVGHYRTKDAVTWCKDKSVRSKFDLSSKRLAVNNILPNSRRKLRCSELPMGHISANSILTISGFVDDDDFYLTMAGLNSFLTEYYLRPSLSNLNLNNFRLYPLPIPTGLSDEIKREVIGCVKGILKFKKFDEENEMYKKIEGLLAASYGLNNDEIKIYLKSFDKVTDEYAQDVIDYAQIYRKKFKLKIAS